MQQYGIGYMLDETLIPDGCTVISAGLGNEFTFSEDLIRRHHCKIIGVDCSDLTIKTVEQRRKECVFTDDNFTHICKALWVDSNGVDIDTKPSNGASVYTSKWVKNIESVSLPELINEYNPSIVKLNVEGAEFSVLDKATIALMMEKKVLQVAVHFHHELEYVPFELLDALKICNEFLNAGYFMPYIQGNHAGVLFTNENN